MLLSATDNRATEGPVSSQGRLTFPSITALTIGLIGKYMTGFLRLFQFMIYPNSLITLFFNTNIYPFVVLTSCQFLEWKSSPCVFSTGQCFPSPICLTPFLQSCKTQSNHPLALGYSHYITFLNCIKHHYFSSLFESSEPLYWDLDNSFAWHISCYSFSKTYPIFMSDYFSLYFWFLVNYFFVSL